MTASIVLSKDGQPLCAAQLAEKTLDLLLFWVLLWGSALRPRVYLVDVIGSCLWVLCLATRQQNIDLQWPQVAFSGVAPFLDPDIHTGAIQNFPEESPLNTLRYLFNAWYGYRRRPSTLTRRC